MSELPEGWAQVPIGTVARIVGGGTPPSKDPANFAPSGQGTPWITPADLSGYRAQTIGRGTRDLSLAGLAACGATLMPKGTVLFSSRAPIGYVAIAANEISTNQGFKSFVLPDGFDPRFTYYQFKHLKPEAEAIATGTTFKELSGAATATLAFKVSPLNEQTRIADQLDTLVARVQACSDRIDSIPSLLKRFRQAVLESALYGGLLTDAESSAGGEISIPIASIATVGTGSTPLRSNGRFFASSGTPWVTSAATSNKLITQANEFVTQQAIEAHRLRLYPKGTLLVAMYGEGKTRGQVAELGIEATINQACAAVVVNETKALTAYVKLALQVNYLSMRELAEGGNQPNLNLSKVKDFQIPLPSLERQEQIVNEANALLSIADRIEARYKAARAYAQRLTPLLLAKAFRGELVPQDPKDEPASVLLERIAAQRAAIAVQPRRRQSTTGRKPARAPKENAAMTKSRQDDDVQGQPYLAKHLRLLGGSAPAEALFKASELPVADFYKQLAWEVAQGHLRDGKTVLELANAA